MSVVGKPRRIEITHKKTLDKRAAFYYYLDMENGFILKNRVKELRARLNMRQADLAREVDVTRQTILAIEKGRLNPSIMVSLKIARVLREPVGYIFYLDRSVDRLSAGEAAPLKTGVSTAKAGARDGYSYLDANG